MKRVFLSLLFVVTAEQAIAADAPPATAELRLGSVAMDIPAAMYNRLKPLTDYLSAELKRPVTLRLAPNMPRAIADVAKGESDIAYLTPVAYIKAHAQGNVRLVAKTVTRGERSFRLMLVTRENGPIRRVQDLAGKSFAFGDEAALLQRAVVVHAGVKLEKLGSHRFLGHYDNIARGVATGDFDAGILKDTTAYAWEKKGLRIIHTSPELPPYNIAVSQRVDEATFQALRKALLALDPKKPAHAPVITALDKSYDGFAATTDAEYNIVRTLIKPFSK